MGHEDNIKMDLKGTGYKDAISINYWQPQLEQPCHYIEYTSPADNMQKLTFHNQWFQ